MIQGESWWLEQPDHKRRPCLVLTRTRSIEVLYDVLAAPIKTTVRNIPIEVDLDHRDGAPRPCVANLHNITSVPKPLLSQRAGELAPGRWHEVCDAMRAAIGC